MTPTLISGSLLPTYSAFIIPYPPASCKAAGEILEKVELFDVYTGEQIAADQKSVAFNLRLRSAERTLTDEEADNAMDKAIAALAELGATLRS